MQVWVRFCLGLCFILLAACASNDYVSQKIQIAKHVQAIKVYNDKNQPIQPYQVIGKVSTPNQICLVVEEYSSQEIIAQLKGRAYRFGGTGIANIKRVAGKTTADVIKEK